MIYYLHPLLAGPVERWARHFEHCADMGFGQILLAPPFLPGRGNNIFLTADHGRLHPRLGQGHALDALADLAEAAGKHGLDLLLDLVIDRVAADSPLTAPAGAYRSDPDALPDPRRRPYSMVAASLRADGGEEHALLWWQQRIGEWQAAGISGFRCDAPQRVSSSFWKKLLADAHRRDPETRFIAWVVGLSAQEMKALAPCGFDWASSSSWAWDFRSDWLEEDARRVTAIGRMLTMPELPFGARLATAHRDSEARGLRGLRFAAAYGQAWLMPMGFEFGAQAPLHPVCGDPDDFAALMQHPVYDMRAAVAEANRRHRGLAGDAGGRMVSAPAAAVAAFLRIGADSTGDRRDHLILANPTLDRLAMVEWEGLLPRLGGLPEPGVDGERALLPAEIRVLPVAPARPVLSPPGPDDPVTAFLAPASRIAIEAVAPLVECGRFAVRRIVGETLRVEADIICDGHEVLGAAVLWRPADETVWRESGMASQGNDRWAGSFPLHHIGRHFFTVQAWVDPFATYREALEKKRRAGQSLALDLREGYDLIDRLSQASAPSDLGALVRELKDASEQRRLERLLAEETSRMATAAPFRAFVTRYPLDLAVEAERKEAGFASWYEMFPRSQSGVAHRHGTFDDVIARLPAVRDMGFDVLYFPPIHPIGQTNRKGRNNALQAGPDDPGSPYAIGSPEGGHQAIHPELGTLADFRRLCAAAKRHGLEVALDFAIQCSPDHPWLREHPDWFSWRPDGSVRHAENPPKKYEDIINVAFYGDEDTATPSLWRALRDVVLFWVGEGIRIFRIDNPHTKPLPFWEWLIGDIHARVPEVIFLAEAFARPKMMVRLAKVGFSQSYTYFTWRNSAGEMRDYLTELTKTAVREFFRPNFFVNTPDINPFFLQTSGRAGFLQRAALAATLSGLWGVYNGFELCEAAALAEREEYRDSEKYQLRVWDHERPGNIVAEISRLNQIRRTNPALQTHLGVRFLLCSNDRLLCYVKATAAYDNILLIVVSFDPRFAQEGDIDFSPDAFGMTAHGPLAAEELMRGGMADWHTGGQRFRLEPADQPFAVWRVRPMTDL